MRSIHRAIWPDLLLIAALIFGAFVRFNPTLIYGFTIKQGGMFAVMIDDLRENQYLIPQYTTYNHLNIPYAYPPLGFYLGGIAADLFGLSADQVLRWLPAFFASLSVPAFYLLALQLLKNKYRAAISTLFFALMPRAFSWFVTGAGLTRSPAQFFMLFTLAAVVRLYEEDRSRDILWVGVFGGLTVMSHPEAALHTSITSVFLWIMLSRSRTGFVHSLGVAAVILLVTSPWWATIVSYHGIEPMLNAAQTGQNASAVLHLLFFVFAEEPYVTFIAIFGLMGLVYSLIRRDYLLPLWIVIPFIVEGRSAAGSAAIPLAMLAAIGLADVVLPPLLSAAQKDKEQPNGKVPAMEVSILIYLMLYLVFSAFQYGLQLSSASLYPPDREAMDWVRMNTPENARFLVLTGTTSLSCDSVLEWFPALTDRQSIYTVQGREWTEGKNFNAYVSSTYTVQRCLSSGDISCLDTVIDRSQYDYVYISRLGQLNNCTPLDLQRTLPLFLEQMRANENFDAVYETDGVIIYKNR
jgi:hypothetical protein